jgi:hypothetical protein
LDILASYRLASYRTCTQKSGRYPNKPRRMGVGFLRPLLGRPIGKQDQGPDDLIAPLGLIHEAPLQLRKLRRRFHRRPFHPPSDRDCHPWEVRGVLMSGGDGQHL